MSVSTCARLPILFIKVSQVHAAMSWITREVLSTKSIFYITATDILLVRFLAFSTPVYPKWSYLITPVRGPLVRLWSNFLREVRASLGYKSDRARFLKKIFGGSEMGKNPILGYF